MIRNVAGLLQLLKKMLVYIVKDPVPADSWTGVLNATTESQACIQKNLFFYEEVDVLVGSEDCLYLNVYTPKVIESISKLYK